MWIENPNSSKLKIIPSILLSKNEKLIVNQAWTESKKTKVNRSCRDRGGEREVYKIWYKESDGLDFPAIFPNLDRLQFHPLSNRTSPRVSKIRTSAGRSGSKRARWRGFESNGNVGARAYPCPYILFPFDSSKPSGIDFWCSKAHRIKKKERRHRCKRETPRKRKKQERGKFRVKSMHRDRL